jgi:hypothetical protein
MVPSGSIPTSTITQTVAPSPLTWSGTGSQVTPFFDLQTGVYKVSAETDSGVTVTLLDSLGKNAGLFLPVTNGGSEIIHIDDTGKYVLDIQGDEYPWKVSITPMPVTSTPTGEAAVLRGSGSIGLGPFYLNQGYNTMVISSDAWLSAEVLDEQGIMTEMTIHYADTGASTHAFNVPAQGSHFLNVFTISNEPWEITIKPGQ